MIYFLCTKLLTITQGYLHSKCIEYTRYSEPQTHMHNMTNGQCLESQVTNMFVDPSYLLNQFYA